MHDHKTQHRSRDHAPEPEITETVAHDLARGIGVADCDTLAAFHGWLKEKAEDCRGVPEIAARLEQSNESARTELSDLALAAQAFAEAMASAPNISEHVRLSYARELAEDPAWEDAAEARRRLDCDLNGATRLFAAIAAANSRVALDTPVRPHLIRLRVAAEHLVCKYEELSFSKFHFSIPELQGAETIWSHPHTSAGAKFVAVALKAIFPTVSDINIVSTLKEIRGLQCEAPETPEPRDTA